MNELVKAMRDTAARLLNDKEVALVLGYEAGSVSFRTAPAFIQHAEDASRLVWNPFCTNNLATYLPELKGVGRIAVMAKGCDARSIATLIQEHQIPREQVMILGIPCVGMIDGERLLVAGERGPGTTVTCGPDGMLTVASAGGQRTVPLSEVLQGRCTNCDHHVPSVADEVLGDAPAPIQASGDAFGAAAELAGRSAEERRAFWRERFERCIRCYACREVCPACYCRTCFLDKPAPRWTSKANTLEDTWMFHAVRAFHLAGRCVSCGECERACPMDIPLTLMNRMLTHEVQVKFGYTAGLQIDGIPPLGTFESHDPDPAEHA